MTDSPQSERDLQREMAARYDRFAEDYARHWGPVINPMARALLEALPLSRARMVLDVGTGSGGLLAPLQLLAPGALIVGVDHSLGMLRIARRANAGPLVQMDAQALAFRPGCADVAILAFCLFHLLDPLRGLRSALAALRPGGVAGVATWGDEPPFPAGQIWNEELDRAGAGADDWNVIARHAEMNSPEKLRPLLEQAGFARVRVWSVRCVQQWDLEGFIGLRSGYGKYRQRLETLAPPARTAFLTCVRARLTALTPRDFRYTPEVVCAAGTRAEA